MGIVQISPPDDPTKILWAEFIVTVRIHQDANAESRDSITAAVEFLLQAGETQQDGNHDAMIQRLKNRSSDDMVPFSQQFTNLLWSSITDGTVNRVQILLQHSGWQLHRQCEARFICRASGTRTGQTEECEETPADQKTAARTDRHKRFSDFIAPLHVPLCYVPHCYPGLSCMVGNGAAASLYIKEKTYNEKSRTLLIRYSYFNLVIFSLDKSSKFTLKNKKLQTTLIKRTSRQNTKY